MEAILDYINSDVIDYPMVIDNDFECFVGFCCELWIGSPL